MRPLVRAFGLAAKMVLRRITMGVYGAAPLADVLWLPLNTLGPKGIQEVRVVARPLAGAELGVGILGCRYVQCYEDAAR